MRLRNFFVVSIIACTPAVGHYTSGNIIISPSLANVAPGEKIVFVATGGSAPYKFSFANGAAASGAQASLDDSGAYRAGVAGAVEDDIVVVDAAGDHATARVVVGPALALSPKTATVAPAASISFVAAGGKAPYTFAVTTQPSFGAIDPQTGVYIGAVGGGSDTVTVSDANAQTATAAVVVGSSLTLTASAAGSPNTPNVLIASGGQAPYHFAFQSKGNRSGGTVNAITGDYLPGDSAQVNDELQVTDATATTVTREVPIGLTSFTVPANVGQRCTAADFNGDSTRDFVMSSDGSAPSLVVARFTTGQAVAVSESNINVNAFAFGSAIVDFNGDGRDDLAVIDNFDHRFVYFGDDDDTITQSQALDLPTISPSTADAYNVTDIYLNGVTAYGDVSGAAVYEAVNLQNFGLDASANFTMCGKTIAFGETWAIIVAYTSAGSSCVFASKTFTFDPFTTLVAGAIDSRYSASPVLAWAVGNDTTIRTIYPSLGTVAGDADITTVALPTASPANFVSLTQPALFIDTTPTAGPLLGVLTYTAQSTKDSVVIVDISQPSVSAPVSPWPSHGSEGFAAPSFSSSTSSTGLQSQTLASDSLDGQIWSVADGHVAATFPFAASCIAALDANSDGIDDLVGVDFAQGQGAVLLGDNDGTFGRHTHYGTFTSPPRLLDIDGDGLTDMVIAVPSGLATLFGGDGQLARGATLSLPAAPEDFLPGAFLAGGQQILITGGSGLQLASLSKSGDIAAPTTLTLDAAQPATLALGPVLTGSGAIAVGLAGDTGLPELVQVVSATSAHIALAPPNSFVSGPLVLEVIDNHVFAAGLGGGGFCVAQSDIDLGTATFGAWQNRGCTTTPVTSVESLGAAGGHAYFAGERGDEMTDILAVGDGTLAAPMTLNYWLANFAYHAPAAAVGRVDADFFADLVVSDFLGQVHIFAGKADGSLATTESQPPFEAPGNVSGIATLTRGASVILVGGAQLVPLAADASGQY